MTGKTLPLDKAGNFWWQAVWQGRGYRIFNFKDKKLTDADGRSYSFAEVEDVIDGYVPALNNVRAARERFLAQRGAQWNTELKPRTWSGPGSFRMPLTTDHEEFEEGETARKLTEIDRIMKGAVTPLPSAESADREDAAVYLHRENSAEGTTQQVGEEDIGKWEDEIRKQCFRHPWAARTKCLITDLRQARERIDSLEQELRKDRAATESIIECQQKELAKQAQKTERLKRLIKQAIQEGDE